MFGSLSTYKIKYLFLRIQAAAHETTHLSQIYFKIDFLVFFFAFLWIWSHCFVFNSFIKLIEMQRGSMYSVLILSVIIIFIIIIFVFAVITNYIDISKLCVLKHV